MQILNIVLCLLTAFIVLVLINDYYQNKKEERWKIENKNGTFDNPITEGFFIPSKFGEYKNINKIFINEYNDKGKNLVNLFNFTNYSKKIMKI